MTNSLIKLSLFLCLMAISLLLLSSCNVARTAAATPEQMEDNSFDISNLVPFESMAENLTFEKGMTMEQVLAKEGVTKKELHQELCRQIAGELEGTRNSSEYFDVTDVFNNPSNYFTGTIKAIGSDYLIDVSLDKAKLDAALREIPGKQLDKHTKISLFQADYMDNNTIAIKCHVYIYWHGTVFGWVRAKWRCYNWVRIKTNYSFNSSNYSLQLNYLNGEIISSKNNHGALLSNVVYNFRKELAATTHINQSIPLSFLKKENLTFKKVNPTNDFISMQFTTGKADLNSIIRHAQQYGFTFTIK